MLYQTGAHNGSNMGQRTHSYPMYQQFQQKAEPLAEVLARRLAAASVSVDNQTERVQAEMVSGNYFTMLGVAPAVGRVFNSKDDDQVYMGHPVVVLGYDYWVRRFASDPGVVGKKILVNNYPMTIVGVSAAGLCRHRSGPRAADPRADPDEGRRWRPSGPGCTSTIRARAGCRSSRASSPGSPSRRLQPSLQGLFLQIRANEATLPGAKDWSAYAREQFMKGQMKVETRGDGLLLAPQRLLHRAHRPHVHGGPRAPDRVRQRGEPPHRARLHAPARDRGAPLHRRLARTARAATARREPRCLARGGGALGIAVAVALTRALLALMPSDGQPLLIQAEPDLRILAFTFALTLDHRRRLRPAARPPREPAGSLDDAQGHGGRGGGRRRLVVPAQGPRHRAGRAQLPAPLRRGALRAQPAEPADHRHRRGDGQPRHVPARARPQRLRRCAVGRFLSRRARSPARGARREVRGARRGGHPERRRMGQHHVGRGPQGGRRRGHAGVHEQRVARLLRDDEGPVHRGARLHAARREADRRPEHPHGGHRQQAVRGALLPRPERGRTSSRMGRRAEDEALDRDRRRRRRRAQRRAARGRAAAGLHPELRPQQRDLLRADDERLVRRLQPHSQRGEDPRRDDAGVRDEDARGAARRDAADRSADRARSPPGSACSRRCSRRWGSTA